MKVTETVCFFIALASALASESNDYVKYMNKWVEKFNDGEEHSKMAVRDVGFNWKEPAEFNNHNFRILTRDDHPDTFETHTSHLKTSLRDLSEDEWAKELQAYNKGKIAFWLGKEKKVVSKWWNVDPLEQGDVAALGKFSTKPPDKYMNYPYDWKLKRPFGLFTSKVSAYKDKFKDPEWNSQWYLQDYRTEDGPVMDHNVVPALGLATGKGVTVAIVDDGLRPHEDFAPNFDSGLCYDVTSGKNVCTPYEYAPGKYETMGTRTAGVIAMQPNDKCGVGVAYGATLAAIKIFGPGASDATDAQAQTMFLDKVDIYSNSWSYVDDGKDLTHLTDMMNNAFIEGATKGRGGKGSIYLFTSGKGKKAGDNCAANGLLNNPKTIVIASTDQLGRITSYSEACSAVMATAYSGGQPGTEAVVSTDASGQCTKVFSGTGASVAIAAGIIALALEANPNLSYRDVMHLITMSAEVAPVHSRLHGWKRNKKGFWVSNNFGFGLLNAENMVTLAKGWANVPELNTCFVEHIPEIAKHIQYPDTVAELRLNTDACKGKAGEEVNFIEQVVVTVAISYPYRGALHIKMHAPSGTATVLMDSRPNDRNLNLNFWPMTSVHNWGEDPKGWWGFEVKPLHKWTGLRSDLNKLYEGYLKPVLELGRADDVDQGWFHYVSLTIYGTAAAPAHYAQLPRKYGGVELPAS